MITTYSHVFKAINTSVNLVIYYNNTLIFQRCTMQEYNLLLETRLLAIVSCVRDTNILKYVDKKDYLL